MQLKGENRKHVQQACTSLAQKGPESLIIASCATKDKQITFIQPGVLTTSGRPSALLRSHLTRDCAAATYASGSA